MCPSVLIVVNNLIKTKKSRKEGLELINKFYRLTTQQHVIKHNRDVTFSKLYQTFSQNSIQGAEKHERLFFHNCMFLNYFLASPGGRMVFSIEIYKEVVKL